MEDQDENRIDEDVARFPCSDCGAKLEFSPGTTLLVCSFCGAENHIALDDETALRRQRFPARSLSSVAVIDTQTIIVGAVLR